MKLIAHVIRFEWKSLWRNSTIKALLLVVLGAGIYGIFFGKFEIDQQNSRIQEVRQYERQQFDSLLTWVELDTAIAGNKEKYTQAVSPTGVGWSKHFTYYKAHEAPPSAGLCLGQRDLFPVYYGFNVSDLARQINVGELANPMKLLTGNFDLSYVFVFLLPLLIVALFYDLYASEEEGGTLKLLQAHSASLLLIIFSRGLLRFLVVLMLATFLMALGFFIQGVPLSENAGLFFRWLMIIYAYGFVWTLIMGAVIALRRGTTLSAMMGLGVWLIFTLITPALLNLFVLATEPLPNRAEAMHVVRNLNDQTWESPKSFVFDQFYPANPQYDARDTTDFSKWYYASFTLIDEASNTLKAEFEQQVDDRNAVLNRWVWLAPPAMVHEQLARISGTDRENHQKFLQEVYAYHQALKDLYYTRIFDGKQFSKDDLLQLSQGL